MMKGRSTAGQSCKLKLVLFTLDTELPSPPSLAGERTAKEGEQRWRCQSASSVEAAWEPVASAAEGAGRTGTGRNRWTGKRIT